ncbi:DNA-directed RNA polymerases II and IV subunit 5A [Asimina triloba]
MSMEESANRLFRIRRTVMQMLRDRGYLVGDFEINMTKNQFLDKYGENLKREDLLICKAKRNDSNDQIRGCGLYPVARFWSHCLSPKKSVFLGQSALLAV